jgi:hypothetical protein
MVDTPLHPSTVPDIVTSLLTTDKELASDAEKRINQYLADSSKSPKDHAYLANVIDIIYGKVAEIKDLRDKLKETVDDFSGINEEGALVVGTLLTAILKSGDIPSMAIYSGAMAAAIKLAFKGAKLWYKNGKRAKLEEETNDALTHAAGEASKIFKDTYPESTVIEVHPESIRSKAMSYALSAF